MINAIKVIKGNGESYNLKEEEFRKEKDSNFDYEVSKAIKVMRKNDSKISVVEETNSVSLISKIGRRYKYIGKHDLAVVAILHLQKKQLIDSVKINNELSTQALHLIRRMGITSNRIKSKTLSISPDGSMMIGRKNLDIIDMLINDSANPYELLIEARIISGTSRFLIINKKMNKTTYTRLVAAFKKHKFAEKSFSKSHSKSSDYIHYDDGSNIKFSYKAGRARFEIESFVITQGEQRDKKLTSHELMKSLVFEKEISEFIDDNIESFPSKSISKKGIIKYSIFVAIVAVTIYLTVTMILTQTSNSGSLIDNVSNIFHSNNKWWFFGIFLFGYWVVFINGWVRKRLIKFQGQDVKTRHIVISSLMGSIISYLTPFAIGGDAIGYWYLRRRGIKRAPLISSFISATVIYQLGLVLQTAFFVAIGIPLYKEILFNDDPQAKAAAIWFFVGVSWNIFATIMILSLSMSRLFQEAIVKAAIYVLEVIPFIRYFDSEGKASKYQYEFKSMRDGMKKIWSSKRMILEIAFYEVMHILFNFGMIAIMCMGYIQSGGMNMYIKQLVASDMISTANSMSLTPGGHGTYEWLSKVVNGHIFVQSGGSSEMTASSISLLWSMLFSWPSLAFSAMLTITIILGSKREDKYNKINKNNRLSGTATSTSTSFYKKTSWIFILYIIAWITLIFAL